MTESDDSNSNTLTRKSVSLKEKTGTSVAVADPGKMVLHIGETTETFVDESELVTETSRSDNIPSDCEGGRITHTGHSLDTSKDRKSPGQRQSKAESRSQVKAEQSPTGSRSQKPRDSTPESRNFHLDLTPTSPNPASVISTPDQSQESPVFSLQELQAHNLTNRVYHTASQDSLDRILEECANHLRQYDNNANFDPEKKHAQSAVENNKSSVPEPRRKDNHVTINAKESSQSKNKTVPDSQEEDAPECQQETSPRERRDSGVGSSLTRAPSDRRRHRFRWHSFVKSHRPSLSTRLLQIAGMSVGQLMLLRKLSLLKVTALMEKYSLSNKSGWNWLVWV